MRKQIYELWCMLSMPQRMVRNSWSCCLQTRMYSCWHITGGELNSQGLEEQWIKTGTENSSRYDPIHTLAAQLGQNLCQVLPTAHSLAGCDYCSMFGRKLSSIKANPEAYLKDFGTMNDIEKQIAPAEEYLEKVIRKPSTCKRI